jgi:hypothetical protein
MSKKTFFIMVLFLISPFSKSAAVEIVNGTKAGSVMLRDGSGEVVYENITGNEYNVARSLVDINGIPALLVLSRDSFYFTLLSRGKEILIDCAYADSRNNYNGARMSAGTCGLNIPLSEDYVEVAQNNSNRWSSSIFSFDTSPVFKQKLATNFLLGTIGDVEIYDRYASEEALENALPQKYIKGPSGCFGFKEADVFLVFLNGGSPQLKYLDILRSEEPIGFARKTEDDLKKLATDKCL